MTQVSYADFEKVRNWTCQTKMIKPIFFKTFHNNTNTSTMLQNRMFQVFIFLISQIFGRQPVCQHVTVSCSPLHYERIDLIKPCIIG